MTLRVGIVGTGYAAQKRAEAVAADGRSRLVSIAGQPERASSLAAPHGAAVLADWQRLVQSDLDLVIVATVNARHAEVTEAALQAGCHVVVEYPLALQLDQALALAQLAAAQRRLLHVEHIELLGGLHQTGKQYLGAIAPVQQVHYETVAPQHPAPKKWSYRLDLAGFPLIAALSRVSRLLDLLGPATSVYCQSDFDAAPPYYRACRCTAQIEFASGATAALIYAKGAGPWPRCRRLLLTGAKGRLSFDSDQGNDQGQLALAGQAVQPIAVAPRRGLFRQDTEQVLAHLTQGSPLYVSLDHSLAALAVADALQRSAAVGKRIQLGARRDPLG